MKYIIEIKPEPISEVDIKDLFKINPHSESDCEFVRITNASTFEPIINLKVESDYSPTFKQSEVVDGIAIIGYGNRFSIFDLSKREIRTNLSFDGYFGSFKVDNGEIFIATDSKLINLNFHGVEKWRTDNLGIDGVVLSKITETEIVESGECDPPGGWKSFKLDRNSGLKK
ncbi:hypothetical protein [Winogradskyella flava]|uniref:hypothetical protein n=1 Tax=Winogradskyella flava TaxID=1884876 RepID=UPI00249165FE|nr:hypothetical protein [Winogradskyella flava]